MNTQHHTPPRRALVAALAALLALVASACSESPSAAVKQLGDAASRRHLIAFQQRFTAESVDSLRRQWREDGISEGRGWMDLLMGYLGDDGEPPDIVSSESTGEDRATVTVQKETRDGKIVQQTLALVKEGDLWKLSLGEMSYQVTDGAGDDQEGGRPAVTLDDGPAADSWDMEEDKSQRKIEDFDLSGF